VQLTHDLAQIVSHFDKWHSFVKQAPAHHHPLTRPRYFVSTKNYPPKRAFKPAKSCQVKSGFLSVCGSSNSKVFGVNYTPCTARGAILTDGPKTKKRPSPRDSFIMS